MNTAPLNKGLLSALALFGLALSNASANSIVVPNANASVAGNSDNRFPLLVSGGMRYQQVFASSEFSGPILIDQIALRNGILVSQPFSANIADIQLSLSTVALAPDALSSTFATNIGLDNTLIYNGSLTLSSSNAAGPGNTHVFDIIINLQTPFLYNPGLGNLLLDVKNNSGADAFVGTNFFDAQSTVGDSISRVFGPEGSANATTGSVDSKGLIVQFTSAGNGVPESSPGIFLLALVFGGLLFLHFRSTIRINRSAFRTK